ncbi:MAG TPA: hypothetical protein VF116_06375 [Ktedonobacterales bacterium]
MYNRPTLSSPTTLGLPEPLERALTYVLGWITGIIFLVIERNPTVRRHAWQSTVVFGILSILSVAFSLLSHIFLIGAIFGLLGWLVGIVTVIAWVGLIILAFLSPHTFINDRRIM